MLEKATLEEITKLRLAPGEEVSVLPIVTVQRGTVMRVTTASGNHYLFEVTDPAAHRTHVVRCDARGHASAGYQGEKVISSLLRVGDQITLLGGAGISYTSAVAGITVLPREVL